MSLLDRLRRLERSRDDDPRADAHVIEYGGDGAAMIAGGLRRKPGESEAAFLARAGYRPGAATIWLPVNGR